MKLYHSPMAPNPDRVVFFLRAKGKLDAVDLEEVSIMKQEHRTKEYREVSPFAQVPALVLDDGTKITESRAICTYFENVFPEPNLMGTDAKEKALIEMWDRRVELMFMVQFATWFRNAHEMMAPLEVPQSAQAAAKGEKNAKRRVPLRRYGIPEEVANMTLSLVLPAASFLTGVHIPVDGGMNIKNA